MIKVTLDIADTPQKRSQGFMFVKAIKANKGMLFVFNEEKNHIFWMKNTFIPLDIIFLNSKYQIIGILKNVTPQTETPRFIDKPSSYVIEVQGGFTSKHGIKKGDLITFKPLL